MPRDRSALLLTTPCALSAHSVDVSGDDSGSEPKRHIKLVPMGVVKGRDGRGPFRLDGLAHAQAVVAASVQTAGSTDIPIDYDHQSVFAVNAAVGGNAPASGWVKALHAKPDGIWADVEWTDAAAAKIKAREYRYISPYFGFETASGRVTRVLSAGLLIYPNFTELPAVASAEHPLTEQGIDMDLKALAVALGLKEDATLEEVTAAAAAAKTKADKADEAVAAATAAAAAPDPKAFVPMGAFVELQATVGALQAATGEEKATAAVDAAVKAGKITPAGREHALSLYKADPAAFAAFVSAAPVVVSAEATDTAAARRDLDSPLTAEERAAASAVGITEEAFIASKKQLAGVK